MKVIITEESGIEAALLGLSLSFYDHATSLNKFWCDEKKEKPKVGSVVIIKHENKTLIGKYRWNKQQCIDNNQPYYMLTVRGFGPIEKIKLAESEWLKFKPLAMEVTN